MVNSIKGCIRLVLTPFLKWRWINYNFGDTRRKIEKNKVNTYYWKPKHGENVGDYISPIVVKNTLLLQSVDPNSKLKDTYRLFGIGSIIDSAYGDVTVWGAGLRSSSSHIRPVSLDVRAVRGPLTHKRLVELGFKCPEIYGDPAVLLPLFYNPKLNKTKDFLIIPHYSKEKNYKEKYSQHILSTFTADWKGFIDNIVSSRLVISGSLHGIIIAEAYGVPAILISDSIDEGRFKYDDYYHSTGRINYGLANNVDQALNMPIPTIPDLSMLRENLLKSFPYDLWSLN